MVYVFSLNLTVTFRVMASKKRFQATSKYIQHMVTNAEKYALFGKRGVLVLAEDYRKMKLMSLDGWSSMNGQPMLHHHQQQHQHHSQDPLHSRSSPPPPPHRPPSPEKDGDQVWVMSIQPRDLDRYFHQKVPRKGRARAALSLNWQEISLRKSLHLRRHQWRMTGRTSGRATRQVWKRSWVTTKHFLNWFVVIAANPWRGGRMYNIVQ